MEMLIANNSVVSLPLRNKVKTPRRIFEIDLLRGILILLMVLDHVAYDFGQLMPNFFLIAQGPQWLYDFSKWAADYWLMAWRINFRYVVIMLFFMLAGLSAYFSRNSMKRGMILLAFGCLLSIALYYFSLIINSNLMIFFGVISCFGVSLIVYSFFRYLFVKGLGLEKTWKWIALIMALGFVAYGYIMRIEIAARPLTAENWWMMFNGRYTPVLQSYTMTSGVLSPIQYDMATKLGVILGQYWYGVDWAGLFPNMGYAFLGGFIGELLYKNKTSLFLRRDPGRVRLIEKIFRPLTFVGSKTLYIYLLHQIVLAGLAFIIMLSLLVPLR